LAISFLETEHRYPHGLGSQLPQQVYFS